MAEQGDQTEAKREGAGWFTTTHGSVVLAAGGTDSPVRDAALEKLCQTYWYPLYAYARRSCG